MLKRPTLQHLRILNDPPHGTERSYDALRLAIALPKHDSKAQVTAFLMADAVSCAKFGQKTREGFDNLERMLVRLMSAGGRVLLCGTCMDARGLTAEEVMPGAVRSTMDELAQTTIAADKVLMVYASTTPRQHAAERCALWPSKSLICLQMWS